MPTKFIKAERNRTYGPPAVSQKYSPLANIDLAADSSEVCSMLLMRRRRFLKTLGLLPLQLDLILPNWKKAIEAEAGKKPPLVVISNNRCYWIEKGLEAAKIELSTTEGKKQFDNASDLDALIATAMQTVSPPIYAPLRIGDAGSRNVYIVVHAAEYETYKTNLAKYGITVVGWQFRSPKRVGVPLFGFGASRFAAIELCKQLRTAADEPWDYAWLMDDNVIAFHSFPGYTKVEDAMDAAAAAGKPCICAGFSGGTQTISAAENKTWAKKEIEEGRGKECADLPAVTGKGLVQQAALWNIAELTRRYLNFGPIFITSAEDMSLSNYFDLKKIPYLYYEGMKVRKEDTTVDGEAASQVVQKGREDLTELLAITERLDLRPSLRLPPPIMFKALKIKDDTVPFDGREQPLGDFIIKTVLPNALPEIVAKAGEKKTQTTAICQAAEQSICKAIQNGLMNEEALDVTFKVNGDKPQRVRRVSKP